MKATGIIRRIDELGRIVIPKEIRKTLKINDGENIEIYTDGDEQIILKKYSNIKNIKDFAQKLTDSIYSSFKNNIIITDTANVIAASGSLKKNILNKNISENLLNFIKDKIFLNSNNKQDIQITDDIKKTCYYAVNPININGDIHGLIILLDEEHNINQFETNILSITSNFLSKYLEE